MSGSGGVNDFKRKLSRAKFLQKEQIVFPEISLETTQVPLDEISVNPFTGLEEPKFITGMKPVIKEPESGTGPRGPQIVEVSKLNNLKYSGAVVFYGQANDPAGFAAWMKQLEAAGSLGMSFIGNLLGTGDTFAEKLRPRGVRVLVQDKNGDFFDSIRPGIEVSTFRFPVGVVGLVLPWNFPISIPAWKIAPALAYGNTVVFKPAQLVPASAHALTEIIVKSGIPDGVFNLVMGKGTQVGDTIVNHSKINAVSFTGSVPTGRKVAASAVARMAKVQLEMGGKNPLIVLDDADLDKAVDCAIQGAFYSTGQRCTASSRLIVTDGIHNKFVDGMKARMKDLGLLINPC